MKSRSIAVLTLILLGLGAGRAPAALPARTAPSFSVTRIDAGEVADSGAGAVKLDGELNEGAWERVTPIRGFLQRDPKEGAPPAFETEVRVLYDRNCIYVGVWALDDDQGKLVGIRTRRDADYSNGAISIRVVTVEPTIASRRPVTAAMFPATISSTSTRFGPMKIPTCWSRFSFFAEPMT